MIDRHDRSFPALESGTGRDIDEVPAVHALPAGHRGFQIATTA